VSEFLTKFTKLTLVPYARCVGWRIWDQRLERADSERSERFACRTGGLSVAHSFVPLRLRVSVQIHTKAQRHEARMLSAQRHPGPRTGVPLLLGRWQRQLDSRPNLSRACLRVRGTGRKISNPLPHLFTALSEGCQKRHRQSCRRAGRFVELPTSSISSHFVPAKHRGHSDLREPLDHPKLAMAAAEQ
jgi:hypothetical protein